MQSCNHNAVILPLALPSTFASVVLQFFSFGFSFPFILFPFIFVATNFFPLSLLFFLLVVWQYAHDHNYVTNGTAFLLCRKLSHLISLITIAAKDQFLPSALNFERNSSTHTQTRLFFILFSLSLSALLSAKEHSIWYFNEFVSKPELVTLSSRCVFSLIIYIHLVCLRF